MSKSETAFEMRQRWLTLIASMPPVCERSKEQQAEIDAFDVECIEFSRSERKRKDALRWIEQEQYAHESRKMFAHIPRQNHAI